MTKNLQDLFDDNNAYSFVRRSLSDEHRAKISTANRGKNVSEETRAKMSAAQRGKKASEETRAKISAAARNISDEHRAKISAASRGRKASEETRAKMSANNAQSRPIVTPYGLFPSLKAAERALNTTAYDIRCRIKNSKKSEYFYLEL